MKNILIVCLGNICRSPMAEAFLRHHAKLCRLGGEFNFDSAGTGNWHVGRPPDWRAIRAARQYGVDLSALRARQIQARDFHRFELVIAMDRHNLHDLKALRPHDPGAAEIRLFSGLLDSDDFVDVPDPYYGGDADFRMLAAMFDRYCSDCVEVLAGNG